MARDPRPISGWPRLMRAATAAAYCDEASVESFLRGVGSVWPNPLNVRGKGQRWLKDHLDLAIDKMDAQPATRADLADVF